MDHRHPVMARWTAKDQGVSFRLIQRVAQQVKALPPPAPESLGDSDPKRV